MRTRVLIATAAVILAAGCVSGCSTDDTSEWNRVVCEVEAVNGGAPLVAAYVVDGGDGIIGGAEPDDSYTIDFVTLAFTARPYSSSTMTIPEGGAYSSFIVTGYNLTWVPGPNTPVGLDLTQYNVRNAPFYVQVPINGDAESAVLVGTRDLKESVYDTFGGPWTFERDFDAALQMEFIGHDSGSQHEVIVSTGLMVNFTFALSKD
ncbi:MAG: hypothetical protein GY838_06675 [bacterium]|nr:hypothetical protein [bacterium]